MSGININFQGKFLTNGMLEKYKQYCTMIRYYNIEKQLPEHTQISILFYKL